MRKEMPEGDVCLQSTGCAIDAETLLPNAEVFEFRNPLVNWLIKIKESLFIQHQRGDRNNWFRQGVDTKDAIGLNRYTFADIEFSIASKMDDFSLTSNQS